jgi:hypothetical protein
LPDNAIAMIENNEVRKYSVVRIADEIVVDLLGKACGIDFAEAIKEVDTMTIDGVKIPVASKELLIKMKDTIRPSDKMDVDFLRMQILENEKNK